MKRNIILIISTFLIVVTFSLLFLYIDYLPKKSPIIEDKLPIIEAPVIDEDIVEEQPPVTEEEPVVENKPEEKEELKEEPKKEEVTPKPEEKPTPEPEVTPTPEPEEQPVVDPNNDLRKNIETKYGVTIYYKDEYKTFKPGNLEVNYLTDEEQIKKELEYLDETLSKYPTNFFKKFKDKNLPINIYLITSFQGASYSGLTSTRTGYITITLVRTGSVYFKESLNHEIMHCIDEYLNTIAPISTFDAEITALNPPGFNYDRDTTNNLGICTSSTGSYFVSHYAQESIREERADLFKIMTRSSNTLTKTCFTDGEIVRQKALILANQINTNFNINTSEAFWNQHLK